MGVGGGSGDIAGGGGGGGGGGGAKFSTEAVEEAFRFLAGECG